MNPEKIKRWFGISEVEKNQAPLPAENPSIVGINFEEEIKTPDDLLESVKRVRKTEWFKDMKGKGLRMVPLPHGKGSLLVYIGTVTALGGAFYWYRRQRQKAKNNK
ncbi:MAG: hypothetical protein NUV73_01330 [Candidatus Daviesbacteria bacterium]|nr:hypothetical protein [Candidatus Daviesbacteria bacterium]